MDDRGLQSTRLGTPTRSCVSDIILKKRPGDSCKAGRPQLRTAGVAGWGVIKAPFVRQLLWLRTCACLASNEIIHEGAESADSGKAGKAITNPTNPPR